MTECLLIVQYISWTSINKYNIWIKERSYILFYAISIRISDLFVYLQKTFVVLFLFTWFTRLLLLLLFSRFRIVRIAQPIVKYDWWYVNVLVFIFKHLHSYHFYIVFLSLFDHPTLHIPFPFFLRLLFFFYVSKLIINYSVFILLIWTFFLRRRLQHEFLFDFRQFELFFLDFISTVTGVLILSIHFDQFPCDHRDHILHI